MKWFSSVFMLIWWLLIAASLSWNMHSTREDHEQFVRETARSMFDHIVLTRSWNAKHGGVYVPVDENTRPNEYLSPVDREIRVNDRLTLTKVNPAFMTRQIGELATLQDGIQFHITSLNPIRPANQPTPLEREVLGLFETNSLIKEVSRFLGEGEGAAFFYMAPLMTEESCMKCHEAQGYQVGSVRGGISVTLPNARVATHRGLVLGHLLIGMVGSLLFIYLMNRLKRAYRKLQQQTMMDALTGVPNRRYFAERVLMEFQRAHRDHTPLSLILCDIDFFKKYNDCYGHQEGDECLLQVAKAINEKLRRPGDICARYGGEEFVILLPNTPVCGCLIQAAAIRTAVENLKVLHAESGVSDYVTVSLGVATDTECAFFDHKELIKAADSALYRAKSEGRNRVCSASGETEADCLKSTE